MKRYDLTMRMRWWVLLGLCLPLSGEASDICDWYRKVFPSMAKVVCSNAGRSRPAGANSTFAGSFNLNPASAPAEPSPYGIETIGSYLRKDTSPWSTQFALIKGFKKFGAGVSTSGSNTFYSNDVLRRYQDAANLETFHTEQARGSIPNINFGTSFPLNDAKKGDLSALKLGVTLRHNQITQSVGGGFGISGGDGTLTYGMGWTREFVSNFLPAIYFGNFLLSYRLLFLELEYNFLKSYRGPLLPPVHIATATISMGRFLLTAAARRLYFVQEGNKTQMHFAVQTNLSQRFSLGYLYNFIPGASSIALQVYL